MTMKNKSEEKIVLTNESPYCKYTYRYRESTEKERQKNRERLARELAKIVLEL